MAELLRVGAARPRRALVLSPVLRLPGAGGGLDPSVPRGPPDGRSIGGGDSEPELVCRAALKNPLKEDEGACKCVAPPRLCL